MNGASFRATVDAFTFSDRATLADGEIYSPPAGNDWLVAEVTMTSRPSSSEVSAAGDVEFLLDVDGSREPVVGLALSPGGSGTEVRTLVAAVPSDAGDVSLVSRETELEQSWSFTTGARAEGAPEVLYREQDSLRADVNIQDSLPFGVDASDGSTRREFGEETAGFSIPAVEVAYLMQDGERRTHAPTAADRAFLYLPDGNADLYPYRHSAQPEDMVLTLPDGTTVEATRLSETSDAHIFGGVVVWEVPADIQTGTITLRPGSGIDPRSTFDWTIDFRDGEVTFDFDLGDP